MSTDDPRRAMSAGVEASFVALDEARAFVQHERKPLPIEPIVADVPSRVLARDEPCADPANCDVHAPYVAAVDEAVEQLAERAKVPAWVLNPEKWQSLSRAERRATARHHEREQRRRRR